MAATMLAGAPLLWSACTDTWNEHYDATPGGMADQPSLLTNIANDASLANFYKVIKNIDAEDLLNSPMQLTVWAPKSLTAAQADSVINVYKKDQQEGWKWKDNKAVTQFLQNHIALYPRQVSVNSNDTVTMRNKKYMQLLGTSATSGSLNGNPFNEMKLCNNGILYKVENVQSFFPNVREYCEQHANMDSLSSFFKQYDEYDLDEYASVAGGVVDGKTVYLDSVVNLYNEMLYRYGEIDKEDSVYTFLAPTDEVWSREYEKYHKYFVYNGAINNADSLADVLTKSQILRGRFFNTSKNWKYNRNPNDSLCNTKYSERQSHNPRQNVYYNPQQNILNGLEKFTCSNGFVYVDNKGMIDPKTTFFGRDDIDASSPFYYEVPKDKSNNETMNVATASYEVYEYDTTYIYNDENEVIGLGLNNERVKKRYSYAKVTAKTSSAHTQLEYTIPSTLSNVYYNVYVVCCPPERSEVNKIPCWFQVAQQTQSEKGAFKTATYFNNPKELNADNCENFDVIQKQGNNYTRCYVTDPTKVDTVLIASGVTYEYSGFGADEGVVRYTISSFGPSGSSYREKIYTRTLRLNEIIMIPFETKEEAEAAANDLDAFNDEKLEALKEK